jgi:uncharacterized membrane protein YjjP (DUF1212 family)
LRYANSTFLECLDNYNFFLTTIFAYISTPVIRLVTSIILLVLDHYLVHQSICPITQWPLLFLRSRKFSTVHINSGIARFWVPVASNHNGCPNTYY